MMLGYPPSSAGGITRVALSPRMRLDSVIEKVRAILMGDKIECRTRNAE
jgi:hypothetical protein